MNLHKYKNKGQINITSGFNITSCNGTQWNATLSEICAFMILKTSNETGQPSKYLSNAAMNLTGGLNHTFCKEAQWNITLSEICNILTADSLNKIGQNQAVALQMRPESQGSVILRYFLISVIFVLIIIGNSLTIHVVRTNRSLTSIKHYYYGYYIMNLSISDLLVGLICLPTTVLYNIMPRAWLLGPFLCKLFPSLQIMVVSASISTLTMITFERFFAIVYPLKPRFSAKTVLYKILFIWIWSFIIALPTLIAFEIDKNQHCIEVGITQWYTITLFMVNYAIPLIFIFLTDLRVAYELRMQTRTSTPRERMNQRRFLKLTVLLMASFALCYLPSNVMFFIIDYSSIQADPATTVTLIQYFHILIWLNSCLNPFIRGSADKYFKRGFKRALGIRNNGKDRTMAPTSRNVALARKLAIRNEKLPQEEY